MKQLACDMCGSNDIIKQDGLFVCQACGTKYSVEEARRMMAGEVVEVEGTVKIDDTSQLSNLYELARRAIKLGNYPDALKYYDQILVKSPNNWESQFYALYCKGKTCNNNEAVFVTKSLSNSINIIIEFVKDNVPQEEQEDIITELLLKTLDVCDVLCLKLNKHYMSINDRKNIKNLRFERWDSGSSLLKILDKFGDSLIECFDGEYSGYAVRSWIKGTEIYEKLNFSLKEPKSRDKYLNFINKIQQYQPDYKQESKGCYVATSVYGSYNCPEVWTLRRFRDNTLDQNIFGKLFIKTYYLTSPTVVKYFGNRKWFNNLFKPILDRFVSKLQDDGVESTFYEGD